MSDGLVIVTGASRGLGRALCELMTGRGDHVVGVSRGPSEFFHSAYTHIEADVGDEAAVVALFNGLRQGAPVRAVINNAGISLSRPAILTTAKAFEDVLRTNLVGAFLVSREAMKAMKRMKAGRIINISSINVPLASAGGAAYNTAKAGLETLARTLAWEVGPGEDITINSIGVSIVADSGMVAGLSDKALADKTSRLSRPALLQPAEVLHAVDFLVSPAAVNITGQTIYFGGMT